MSEFAPKIAPEKVAPPGGGSSNEETSAVASKLIETKSYDRSAPLSSEQQKLVEQGYGQVKIISSRMFPKYENVTNFQLSDFIGWGTEGLVEAAQKFDLLKGYAFTTFAAPYISGRILDNIRSYSLIPRRHLKFLRDRKKAITQLALDREATDQEIADKMGLDLSKYVKQFKKSPVSAGLISLDRSIKDGDDSINNGNSFLDNFIQKLYPYRPGYSERDIKEEKIELLNKFLAKLKLNERDREIINLYFMQGINLEEIGNKFGVTESRVCQIIGGIIGKLRKYFEQEGYHVSDKIK